MSRESQVIDEGFQIRFDGPPSHDAGRFIEVEDLNGRSIRHGEWREDSDGYWLLVFEKERNSEDE